MSRKPQIKGGVMSMAQIAKKLGISETTVSWHLHRGLKKIRARLMARMVESPELAEEIRRVQREGPR